MKRSALFCASLLAFGSACAADGPRLGVGVDYSSGDYGTSTTTEILSVPFTAQYTSGNWTYKASLPWLYVSGNPNVLPGLGSVDNTNPHGRGRHGGGPPPPGTQQTGSASGIGDLRLAATYSFDTGGPLGVDLTGNVKVGTASADKGLGTGANDYGLALDLYRAFGRTTLFGGVGYTVLGQSDFIDVNSVANVNLGASWKVGSGSLGAMYDWRQAAATGSDDRSELTGFYSFGSDTASKFQVYATAGLSNGSPDFGGGVSYTRGF